MRNQGGPRAAFPILSTSLRHHHCINAPATGRPLIKALRRTVEAMREDLGAVSQGDVAGAS